MNQIARALIGLILLTYLFGTGSHFNFWANRTLFSQRQETVDYRKVNDLTTLTMGMANPIFGIGFGNFRNVWPKYFRSIDGNGVRDLTDGNHNTFLGIFAEVGLIGLVPFLMIFYHMFRIGLRAYATTKGFEKDFALVFLLVLVTYAFGANFSDYRSGPFFNTTLFAIFGCVAAMDLERRRPIVKDLPVPSSRGEFGAEPS